MKIEIDLRAWSGRMNPAQNDPWTPQDSTISHLSAPQSDPLRHMVSSEEYIASLESKLKKIQKRDKAPSSKDMISSLSEVRESYMHNLVESSSSPYISNHEYVPEENETSAPLATLQRRIHPERQALTTEELVILVDNDDLAKQTTEEAERMQGCTTSDLNQAEAH